MSTPTTPKQPIQTDNEGQPGQSPVPTQSLQELSLGSANNGTSTEQAMEVDSTGKDNDCTSPGTSTSIQGSVHSMHAEPVRVALAACKAHEDHLNELEKAYSRAAIQSPLSSQSKALLKELREAQCGYDEAKAAWHKAYPLRLEFFSAEDFARVEKEEIEKKLRLPTIVPKDLPALQITGMTKWHPRKVVHDSAAAFLRAFENELGAYSLKPAEHWERLLPMCLSDSQNLKLEKQIAEYQQKHPGAEVNFDVVSKLIKAKYDTQLVVYMEMTKVVRMKQAENEPIDAYITKFQDRCIHAGMSDGLVLVITFLSSLNKRYHEQALRNVIHQYGRNLPTQLDEVCDLVAAMELAEGTKHQHQDEDRGQKRQWVHKEGPAQNRPPKQAKKDCWWCGRPWKHGHSCSEYKEKLARGEISKKTPRPALNMRAATASSSRAPPHNTKDDDSDSDDDIVMDALP